MSKTRLIRLLQQAHAIEIGAFNAYEDHWKSLKDPSETARIQAIQQDELQHRIDLANMLAHLNAKPSKTLNFIFMCIGKAVSVGCNFFPYSLAMFGAQMMERIGDAVYGRLVTEAEKACLYDMADELREMQANEKLHEFYLKSRLVARRRNG